MPPPLCFCRTVRRDTRKPHFPNKSPLGSSRAREQTTETPSTEATPEHPPGLLQRAPFPTSTPSPPLPSYRTPIRYLPLPRLTAPRCGIHGGGRVAHTLAPPPHLYRKATHTTPSCRRRPVPRGRGYPIHMCKGKRLTPTHPVSPTAHPSSPIPIGDPISHLLQTRHHDKTRWQPPFS